MCHMREVEEAGNVSDADLLVGLPCPWSCQVLPLIIVKRKSPVNVLLGMLFNPYIVWSGVDYAWGGPLKGW